MGKFWTWIKVALALCAAALAVTYAADGKTALAVAWAVLCVLDSVAVGGELERLYPRPPPGARRGG